MNIAIVGTGYVGLVSIHQNWRKIKKRAKHAPLYQIAHLSPDAIHEFTGFDLPPGDLRDSQNLGIRMLVP